MMTLGPIGFAAPWALIGLLALPVIWWLVRALPPQPRRKLFAPWRLLFGLKDENQTPARTPWWLVLLRMLAAALALLGLSRPILFPQAAGAPGDGAILLAIDDGWPSAPVWDLVRAQALDAVAEAERANATVTFLFTAPQRQPLPVAGLSADRARALLQRHEPSPWKPDPVDAARRLQEARPNAARVLWLSDGLTHQGGGPLAESLAAIGPVTVRTPPNLARAITAVTPDGPGLSVTIARADPGPAETVVLTAEGLDGRDIASAAATFALGAKTASASLAIPAELMRRTAAVRIDTEASAGAVAALDTGLRRATVGLVEEGGQPQPLLSDLYYVDKAIRPFADARRARLDTLVDTGVEVIVLADVGRLAGPDLAKLTKWVEAGGLLIRFAGPRLAAQADDLTPTRLRPGARAFGSALGWDRPQGLSKPDAQSPFYNLAIPSDVQITQIALGEPTADPAVRVWARLEDGAPLVTAANRGRGLVVLYHVTAGPAWSNLPLSGLYVDMLKRTLAFAGPSTARRQAGDGPWTLARGLDGFGRWRAALPTDGPASAQTFAAAVAGPQTPPGIWRRGGETGALNAGRDASLAQLGALPRGVVREDFAAGRERAIAGPLLGAAGVLLLIDILAALFVLGRWAPPGLPKFGAHGRTSALAAAFFCAALWAAPAAQAQTAAPSALDLKLAYVRTGEASLDRMAEAGLRGLSRELAWRTSVEPGAPIGVDIERDDLSFYPMLFWTPPAGARSLSPAAQAKLNAYLKTGGTLVIDTRDADRAGLRAGGERPLEALLEGIDAPPLTTIGSDHVITKAFYLLAEFPGRVGSGRVWVEAQRTTDRDDFDGVSALVIGSSDWAGAWAIDANGRALAAVDGGERARELSFRFGINLVMYVLTGNYKADQVHVPALLERMGRAPIQ